MQNNDRHKAQTAPQEQGFVGGGYDPFFTWGGFEDHVMAEERVDAAAADPRGGAQPPGYVGQAGADAGDDKIEMYSDDAGQAGADAGENHIEITLEEAAGQEPFIGTPRPVSEDERLRKSTEHNQTQVSEWDPNGAVEARDKEVLGDAR